MIDFISKIEALIEIDEDYYINEWDHFKYIFIQLKQNYDTIILWQILTFFDTETGEILEEKKIKLVTFINKNYF